jgi:hypothetical protein
MGITGQKHLAQFRRTLRKEDQGLFDELFERARQRQQAAVQAANAEQMESIFIAVLIDCSENRNACKRASISWRKHCRKSRGEQEFQDFESGPCLCTPRRDIFVVVRLLISVGGCRKFLPEP